LSIALDERFLVVNVTDITSILPVADGMKAGWLTGRFTFCKAANFIGLHPDTAGPKHGKGIF
jgi:hypothetical protein